MANMLPRIPTVLLALGLFCVLQLSLAQDITCPAELIAVSNGSVEYSELPTTTPVSIPVYNPGAIGGWYNLVGGFVDGVRPGTLPYEVIEDGIEQANLRCSINPTSANCTSTASNFDIPGLLQGFASWWTWVIVFVAIGAILSLLFLIVGCIFWCCRCCGNCGGSRKATEYQHNDCKTITFTIILLLFTLLLLAGVILAFFSNEQSYRSLANFQTSINNAVDVATAYVGNAVDQIETLLCQFLGNGGVATTILDEALALNESLADIIANIRVDVVNILETLDDLTTGINNTLSVLTNINTTSDTLEQLGNNLQDTTNAIASNVSSLTAQCMMIVPAITSICNQIPPSDTFATGADFSQLPDISGQISDVSNALQGVDLQQQIQDGLQTFDDTTQNIQNQVNSNLDSSTGALSQIMQLNGSIFETLGNVTSTVRRFNNNNPGTCPSLGDVFSSFDVNTLNVGFVRECLLNQGIDFIQQYDVYRYAFGIVFCSLGLVTIVLVSLGIVFGMVGFRRDTRPYERNKVSHCGGIFLLIAVGFTFLFGFLLMVLATIGYFFGTNAQKVCQSLAESQDYPVFTNIIDNTELWGGSLLGILIFQNLGFNGGSLFISGALRNCQQDMALYTAFNLSNLLPSGNISQEVENTVNLTQVTGQISNLLDDAVTSFNFQNDSFLPSSAQDAIQQFTNANVNGINITSFRQQIEAPLVQFSINETIQNLTALRDTLNGTGSPAAIALADQTQYIIDALNDLQDNQIPAIRTEVDSLEEGVNELSTSIASVVMSTTNVTNRVNEVVQQLTGETLPNLLNETVRGALDRVVNQINGYVAYLDTSLSNDVARCQPIIVVYEEIYNSVCRVALDGLNGFWWSLGFCGVLFIPIIIFAVITSVFYLRMKYYLQDTDDSYVDYSDYPMKSY